MRIQDRKFFRIHRKVNESYQHMALQRSHRFPNQESDVAPFFHSPDDVRREEPKKLVYVRQQKSIFRIAEMSDERLRVVMKVFEDAKFNMEPLKAYNSHGYLFGITHMDRIHGNIIHLPLEHMAMYAEKASKETVDRKDGSMAKKKHEWGMPGDYDMQYWQPWHLGNMAYAHLNDTDEEVRQLMLIYLENYYDFFARNVCGRTVTKKLLPLQ